VAVKVLLRGHSTRNRRKIAPGSDTNPTTGEVNVLNDTISLHALLAAIQDVGTRAQQWLTHNGGGIPGANS
jgi:hypothetical protein